jgi:ESS family glutamate:Na+ symporter
MDFDWRIFIDLGLISGGLLLATFIRSKITFFQKYLIPNALTAGFLLLPIYNFVLPLIGQTQEGLGTLAYHLLSISFIAMALRKSPASLKRGDGRIFATTVAVLSQYAILALIGLLLTLLLILTAIPELYHPFGFMLPLGYALGPGQAFAIGRGWEALGVEGAGSVGLTFAALGFLFSCFGGVFVINYGIKKGWAPESVRAELNKKGVKRGVFNPLDQKRVGSYLTSETEAIDTMSLNTGVVLFTYLLTFLLLTGLTSLLSLAGEAGSRLATNLWGISFIFAAVLGLFVKMIMRKVFRVDYVLENHTLNRLAGLSVDIMVTAAVAGISLVVVQQLLGPILLLGLAGGFAVLLTVPWIGSRIFHDHRFHRMLLVYGVSTGTLSTGLALLRVIDPDFETPVASDYTYASGLSFVLGIPFILSINLPLQAFLTGDMTYFWVGVLVSGGYLAFTFISYMVLSKGNAFAKGTKMWLHRDENAA